MRKETLKHALMQTTTVFLMIIILGFVSIPQCVVIVMDSLHRWKMRLLHEAEG